MTAPVTIYPSDYRAGIHTFYTVGDGSSNLSLTNFANQIPIKTLTIINSNVGIGTGIPNYKLDVTGDVNFTGILRQNGTPYISSQWITSNNNIYYNNGNVGVGTTIPLDKLHVEGSSLFTGPVDVTTTQIILAQDLQTASLQKIENERVNLGWTDGASFEIYSKDHSLSPGDNKIVYGATNGAVRFAHRDGFYETEQVTILQNGNVGIGSTEPAYKLDVIGDINYIGTLYQNGTPAVFGGGSSQWITNGSNIYYNSGNIGIGTTNPLAKLHVEGNILTSNLHVLGTITYTANNNDIQVTPIRKVFYTATVSQNTFILEKSGIYGGYASNTQVFVGQNLLSYYNSTINDYSLSFTHNSSNTIYTVSLTEPVTYATIVDITIWPTLLPSSTPQSYFKQTLNTNTLWTYVNDSIYYDVGNVGIGTTLPSHKLDVNGDINFTGILRQNSIPYISSQWTTNETDIYYTMGNIGIGTASPEYELDVNGTIRGSNVLGVKWNDVQNKPFVNELPVGTIIALEGEVTPDASYILANGQTLNRTEYVELANALNIPAGQSTFTVPDISQKYQVNWNETDINQGAYIKNKPNIVAAGINTIVSSANIVPSTCNVYDLGTSNLRWRDLYLSGNTIDLGGTFIKRDSAGGGIKIESENGQEVDTNVRNVQASGYVNIAGTKLERHVTGPLMVKTAGGEMESGMFKHVYVDGTMRASNLEILGDFVTLNTVTSNTEQIVVTNAGTGPALKVTQTGAQPVAEFYDNESGLAMTIANNGNVGIGTMNPTVKLQVEGNTYMNGNILSPRFKVHTICQNLSAPWNININDTYNGGTVIIFASMSGWTSSVGNATWTLQYSTNNGGSFTTITTFTQYFNTTVDHEHQSGIRIWSPSYITVTNWRMLFTDNIDANDLLDLILLELPF